MEENNIINLSNNNNILVDISSKLEEIMDIIEDNNISNKMKEILELMNKVINDNSKLLEQILNSINNTNDINNEEENEIMSKDIKQLIKKK